MNPDALAVLIPIVALMIPIVAILTKHQQKMAELIHGSQGRNLQSDAEMAALRAEISDMKQLIHQQTIALDGLTTARTSPPPIETVQERLNS